MTANKTSNNKKRIINWTTQNLKILYFKGHHQVSEMSDFPVGPMVKTLPSNAEDADSVPGQGAHTSHTPHRQKKPKHKAKAILQQIQ